MSRSPHPSRSAVVVAIAVAALLAPVAIVLGRHGQTTGAVAVDAGVPAAGAQAPAPPAGGQAPRAAPAPAAELPGGGRRVFDGRVYVALYGHPGVPALGVLGEQGRAATIARAKRQAKKYEAHTSRKVIPALEIITTIATRGAGADGDYSAETPVSKLRPLVREAGRAGQYVILDLQPGRADLLTQAKRYRELLLLPHVGLALDPEWKLTAKQKPLRQIGSVSAAEINRVSAWLAQLTREAGLPQKMLLLHQFTTRMIRDRGSLQTGHPELAITIQMDGHGGPGAKKGTYRAIRAKAPAGVTFGWKNFIDEDSPMLSPKATMEIKPQPRWVSYQ